MNENNIVIKLHKDYRRQEIILGNDGQITLKRSGLRNRGRKMTVKEQAQYLRDNNKKAIRIFNATYLLVIILILGGILVWNLCPEVVVVNGNDVCYLKNADEAEKAMNLLVEQNTLEDSNYKAVKIDADFKVEKKFKLRAELMTAEQAAEYIDKNYVDTDVISIETSVAKERNAAYTPEVEYKKDDTMLAGEAKTEYEGKKGEQIITTMYHVENGEVLGEQVVKKEVLDYGEPAIIVKGTIGLPEGEDWRTYEGLPEFQNGAEMITNAKHYLGLRYVWGGHSLVSGVDCVGFVTEMYRKFGINLPRSHTGLRKAGKAVGSIKDAKAGDIICYNGHVALYMGNGKVIHATRGKSNNVHISKVNYNKKRHIITIRRVVQ